MNEVGKNYLIDTISSLFHEKIIAEAKLNIKELHSYFDPKGVTYATLLDVLYRYDSNKISKFIIKDSLMTSANRTEEEAMFFVNRLDEARDLNDEEVDKFKKRVKEICYQAALEDAKVASQGDLELYKTLVATYQYKDLGSSSFVVKDIGDLDVTQLTEKYLSHPIPSKFESINRCFAGKRGYLRSSIILITAPVKCGKSLFLMSEACSMARRGFKVHYLALGDLNELDFLVRMAAQDCHVSMDVVYSDVLPHRNKMMEHIKEGGGCVKLTCMPSGKLTPEEYANVAMNRLKDMDVLMIDYDLNFKMLSDNMYSRGGELYDLLSVIKDSGNQLVLVATQPQRGVSKDEVLDETCFIESSKKAMIIDAAFTISKLTSSGTPCGYFNIPINRRGTTALIPYIRTNDGNFNFVSETFLADYANDPVKRDIGYKELQLLLNNPENVYENE